MNQARLTNHLIVFAGIVVLFSFLLLANALFAQYKGVFVLIQDSVIIGLLGQIIRSRKLEKTLRDSEYRYRTLVRQFESDLTERKRAEDALRMAHDELEMRVQERTVELAKANETLHQLEKAVETMQIGVTIADPTGKILYTNPADAKMHGYSVEDLIGQDVQIFAPPRRRQQMTVEQVEEMKGWVRESLNMRKDNSIFPVYLMSSIVKDESGRVTAIVTTCEDITERKQTEKELAEERNLLRTLIDSIPDYIYVKDTESRFMLVNSISASSMGVPTATEFIGKTDFDILPHEFAERFYADDLMVIRSGRPLIDQEEPNINPKTGDRRWFSTTKVPLRNSQGEIVGLVGISRDITAHKQTEARIEHINAVLRAIRDVNQLIVREKDRNHLIQQVCNSFIETRGFNAAWIALLDESGKLVAAAESGLGQKFDSLKEHLAQGEAPPCVQKALAQPETLILEELSDQCPECSLSGMYREYQEMIIRLEHAGKCYGILATFLPKRILAHDEEQTLLEEVAGDIGFALYSIEMEEERKRAEKALEHERQRLFDLLEKLPVYVYLQAPDYTIRFANRCFRERFGEPERKHYYRLLWGRGHLWEESPAFRVFTTQKPYEWEWDHYPTGKIYHVYDYPFTDFDGSPLVLELGIDITERKQVQLTLEEERASLAKKVAERTAELSEINQRLQQEIEERKRAETWLLSMNDQLQEEITERKQVEEELQQAKEAAESANSAKSEFLANMSHELRTPLNAILGYAQILKTADNLTKRQIEGLETIKNSGQHLLNLINEILDLSKIEAGRIELELSKLHLAEFLIHIAEMMRIRAEQKGLAFVYEPESDLPEGVLADEKKLRQVLINLLGNAVKFTEKGRVTFKIVDCGLRIVDLGDQKSEIRNLKFEIEDTGIGIASDRLEEIFLPFQQIGEKRDAVEGTGLGLAISRKLVRLMAGELMVSSTVGKGSVFWFDLDLQEIPGFVPEPKLCTRKIIGYTGEHRTVLIADDRKENRAVLVNMLLPLGFKILEAENGQECLEKTLTFKPDAILLDLRMPIVDGFETAKQIRQLDNLHDVVIIAVSASVYEEIQQKSLQAGCDVFLTKPVQLETILDILHTHLQLEWSYEEEQKSQLAVASKTHIDAELSIVLPEDQLKLLIELASKGRVKKLLQSLARIEASDQRYQPFIEELRQLTKNFQLKAVIECLEHTGDRA